MNAKIPTAAATWCALVLVVGLTATAEDWPQWGRTSGRNMVSSETGLPETFEPGQPKAGSEEIDLATTKNVLWVAKMGSNTYGNPTVAAGRVYVGTNNDGNPDPRFKGDHSLLKCLDEKTGKLIWQLTVPKLGSGKVGDWEFLGICSSPCVEENRVYLVTNRCEVICLDARGLANGNDGAFQDEAKYMVGLSGPKPPVELQATDADILWRFDMRDILGIFPHNITSSSVMVVGDTVFASTSNGVDWSHTNIPFPQAPSLIALDKHTGELLGEEASGLSTRILHGNWSSPAYGEDGGRGVVVFGGPDGICYGFDPKPIPDPDDPEFRIFKEVWQHDCNPPHYRMREGKPIKYVRPDGPSEIIATPIVVEGRIYVAIGQDPEHGEGLGNLSCLDLATGEVIWQSDKIRRAISTCAVADGLLYIGDYSGYIHCLDAATGEQVWVHDTMGHIWGSPLVADGKVYVGNEDGILTVLAAGRTMKLLSEIELDDPIYSSPIAANGVLYIATMSQLYAIKEQK